MQSTNKSRHSTAAEPVSGRRKTVKQKFQCVHVMQQIIGIQGNQT